MKRITTGVICLILSMTTSTWARDISPEQRAASDAREQYRQLSADYDGVTKQVQDMEKYAAQVQAKLRELREKQNAVFAAREKAKTDVEAKEKIVDLLWDQRNK